VAAACNKCAAADHNTEEADNDEHNHDDHSAAGDEHDDDRAAVHDNRDDDRAAAGDHDPTYNQHS
jgi:hypothetical protein